MDVNSNPTVQDRGELGCDIMSNELSSDSRGATSEVEDDDVDAAGSASTPSTKGKRRWFGSSLVAVGSAMSWSQTSGKFEAGEDVNVKSLVVDPETGPADDGPRALTLLSFLVSLSFSFCFLANSLILLCSSCFGVSFLTLSIFLRFDGFGSGVVEESGSGGDMGLGRLETVSVVTIWPIGH